MLQRLWCLFLIIFFVLVACAFLDRDIALSFNVSEGRQSDAEVHEVGRLDAAQGTHEFVVIRTHRAQNFTFKMEARMFPANAQFRFFDDADQAASVKSIAKMLETLNLTATGERRQDSIPGVWRAYKDLRSKAIRSDLWRYMFLWRYGGLYLDSDMIVKKSLSFLNSREGLGLRGWIHLDPKKEDWPLHVAASTNKTKSGATEMKQGAPSRKAKVVPRAFTENVMMTLTDSFRHWSARNQTVQCEILSGDDRFRTTLNAYRRSLMLPHPCIAVHFLFAVAPRSQLLWNMIRNVVSKILQKKQGYKNGVALSFSGPCAFAEELTYTLPENASFCSAFLDDREFFQVNRSLNLGPRKVDIGEDERLSEYWWLWAQNLFYCSDLCVASCSKRHECPDFEMLSARGNEFGQVDQNIRRG